MNTPIQLNFLRQMEDQYGVDLLEELIVIYQKQMNEMLIDWKTNLDSITHTQLKMDAHKLKSSARNVGAFKLAELLQSCEKSEKPILNERLINEIEKLFLESIETAIIWRRKKEAA